MDTALTMDEIDARFDGEWVLVEDPITNAALEVERGKVRFHGTQQQQSACVRTRPIALTLCTDFLVPCRR